MTASIDRERSSGADFIREVHGVVRDLLNPRPVVYWTDFLVSLVIGSACMWLYLTEPAFSVLQVLCFFIAGILFYRVSTFTHELAHLRERSFLPFRIAWNVFFGIPCMMPSFLYGDHKSHHANHLYGTQADGEYFPLGLGPVGLIIAYLAHITLVPVLSFSRFVLLAPLSLLHPRIRKLVWERFSSIATMNPRYQRPEPHPREKVAIILQEAGCFLFGASLLVLVFTGVFRLVLLPKVYLLFLLVATLNYVRQLGAHRYLNSGEPMSYVDQLLDTTTIPGMPLVSELWAPLGMRFHALHHLVPSLPYHAMSTAHRRLMHQLPSDSPYHDTVRSSLASAIWEVVRNARAGR